MKQIISAALVLLLAATIAFIMPTEAEAKIYDDTLRLHILAPSDSVEDQALKLKIRDALLLEYGDRLSLCKSAKEAIEEVEGLMSDINESVNSWIENEGYEYKAQVILEEEWYDTREYGELTLPCGIYHSLKIIIGEGEGQNWWCVMYPPLCLDLACESAKPDDGLINYTNEETRLVTTKKYNVKFKILEIISDAFSKKG